ncbi:MAG: SDR family oxidoreductase [Pseudomonadota bacterium]
MNETTQNDRGTLVVTGAASGIGAETAVQAAALGYGVCVNYRNNEEGATRVAEQVQDAGGRCVVCHADVREPQSVEAMFDVAEKALGPLVGVVNNAAVLEPQSDYAGIDAARVERILATNVIGAFNCAREGLNRMRHSRGGGGGAIVNVSSIAARTGSPKEYVDYAMSKGALDTMTVGLAKEVAADGVRVNGVRPGFIHTGMHAKGGEPGRVERLRPVIPMGRGGEAQEVAAAILWLLSDAASFTTGAFIDVGGGI